MARKKTISPPVVQPNEIIDDGFIEINVKGGEHAGKHSIDVMSTKLAMESVERKHGTVAENWTATGEFLKDLAAAVATHLGWQSVSGTFAYQLWFKVSAAWVELKKNMP